MSKPRDLEEFLAGFRAGLARDFSALVGACAVPAWWLRSGPVGQGSIWLRDPAPGPTQADRDHFHKLLATAMTERPGVRMSWRDAGSADVTGWLARESIPRPFLSGSL